MGKKRAKVAKKNSGKTKRSLKWLLFKYAFIFGLGGIVSFFLIYYLFVVSFPGRYTTKESVMNILSRNTVVYYSDGKHVLGSYFDKNYRMYVPINKIPKYCRQAIVASEDSRFYKHAGVNLFAIARAFIIDIIHRKVVQGGSTITQQTAKNLFGRRGRTLSEKMRELINAFRLEKYFTKDQILEFYLNQFYVKGQGRGIGVAAKYFFNKQVEDLSLKECAFITGSVKGPARYNIFTASGTKKEKIVKTRIKNRVHYVLKRMYKNDYISEKEYKQLLKERLVFKQGKYKHRPSVTLDVVTNILNSPSFEMVWYEEGIENISTAGLKIITSIDYDMERTAQFALRKQLSYLDTQLDGYKTLDRNSLPSYSSFDKGFYVGKVLKTGGDTVTVAAKIPSYTKIKIDLKKCLTIPRADYYNRFGKWAGSQTVVKAFIKKRLKSGNFVLFSNNDGDYCIEKYPKLEGGVLATQAGEVKAMVGGFSNVYYNRAWIAKRQPGSIFKIPLYLLYFMTGQLNTDLFPDEDEMYVYQGTLYFPRPDHKPHSSVVSVAWAGAYSENLASINILFHLFDHLTDDDFTKVANYLGLLPEKGEEISEYRNFMETSGLTFTKRALFCSLVEELANKKVVEKSFEMSFEEVNALRKLKCSGAVSNARRKLEKLKNKSDRELKKLKIMLYEFKFLKEKEKEIDQKLEEGDLTGLKIVEDNGNIKICTKNYSPCTGDEVDSILSIITDDYYVEGVLPKSDLDLLERNAEERLSYLVTANNLYSPEILIHFRDFKIFTALKLFEKITAVAGRTSKLHLVPSLPLGSSPLTLPEINRIYTFITQGLNYNESDQPYNLSVIKKIYYNEKEIYSNDIEIDSILPKKMTAMVNSVLEKVFQIGTAKRMWKSMFIKVKDKTVRLPILGKTGTTNNFTNSSFTGVIPVISRDGETLNTEGGVVISSYIGYDNNRSMKKHSFKVFGSNGALPVVASVAKKVIEKSKFNNILDLDDKEDNYFIPLELPDNFVYYKVDAITGIPLTQVDINNNFDIINIIETSLKRGNLWLPENH